MKEKCLVVANLMLAVELYRNKIITLGKFTELIGLPVHDSARILESIGIKPELGANTKKELDEEIETSKSIVSKSKLTEKAALELGRKVNKSLAKKFEESAMG